MAIGCEVPPQRPEHQRGLILLDGELPFAAEHPGMPAAALGAIWPVFMREITLPRDRGGTELIDDARHIVVPRSVQSPGHEGTVAGPHVIVRIPVELGRMAESVLAITAPRL